MSVNDNRKRRAERLRSPLISSGGYAMAALLVGLSVMAMALAMAVPCWQTIITREREAELVFRGEQYARAIRLYQRRFEGALPRSIEALVEGRFLRRRYPDPITDRDFRLLFAPAHAPFDEGARTIVRDVSEGYGGIVGVVSGSGHASLASYHGATRYDEWLFTTTAVVYGADAPSQQAPERLHNPTRPFGQDDTRSVPLLRSMAHASD